MRRKLTYTIIFILSTIISGFATSYKPVVSNYSTQSYGISAGVQNWSCHQGKNGEMYFGNNRGMLSFDGYNWKLYHLPNKQFAEVFLQTVTQYLSAHTKISDIIKETAKVNSFTNH